MGHLTDSELKDRAQAWATGDGPAIGSKWKHYKTGGHYIVVARSLMEDTLEPLVTYYSVDKGTYWTRALRNFEETVVAPLDGQRARYEGPRFTRVEEMTS
jgi:hypothetical protein